MTTATMVSAMRPTDVQLGSVRAVDHGVTLRCSEWIGQPCGGGLDHSGRAFRLSPATIK